jgi:hypothetical protein
MVLTLIGLLALGASPASATDTGKNKCESLLKALEVLQAKAKPNAKAINKAQTKAENADCFATPPLPTFKELCESYGKIYQPDYDVGESVLYCYSFGEANPRK